MRQIYGYVFVKETNLGVPNLVVAVYDSEKSIQEIIRKHSQEKYFSTEDFGKRVGSVLTNQEGKFIFTAEDLEFQGNEARIDLLIVVFAPEDIRSAEEPYPLPPEARILYISTVPRDDAGSVEAFVIRLLQAQLDQFQIYANNSRRESKTDSQRYVNAIQSAWDFRDSVREKLKPRLQEEQARSEKFEAIAQKKVQNLSAIPLHLRDGKLRNTDFLIIGKQNLGAQLNTRQDAIMTEGFERMAKSRPTLRLRLTKTDLEDLGLKIDGDQILGQVSSEKLAEKARSLMNGFDLVRLREPDNPSPDELERIYLAAGLTPDAGKKPIA